MKRISLLLLLIASLLLAIVSCNSQKEIEQIVDSQKFDTTIDGKAVKVFYLSNNSGMEMAVTNLGARVVALLVPDKDGKKQDVVLGCEKVSDYYHANTLYYGAAIGRYGNRIAKGQFEIDADTFKLAQNNNGQALHGGPTGYHFRVWDAIQTESNSLELTLVSIDGDEGYPGNLSIKMVYSLTDSNEFKITYEAQTDKKTIVNLTHHTYFNLNGAGNGSINNHLLQINADQYNPVDSVLIPTGIAKVVSTPMDFRIPTEIGARVDQPDFVQLKLGNGYDHNWIVNRPAGSSELILDASLYSPVTGIVMDVISDQPGIQFYGGNFMGNDPGKVGKRYNFREGLCLETQKYPDSPNQSSFPSTMLSPGETYTHTCIYKFGVK